MRLLAPLILGSGMASAAAAGLQIAAPSAEAVARAVRASETTHNFALQQTLDAAAVAQWQAHRGVGAQPFEIFAPGAVGLSLYFDRYALPDGAQLTVRNPSGTVVQGPYTNRQGRKDRLWTGLIPGERALVFLQLPSPDADFKLNLAKVAYGFANPRTTAKRGSCNIDAACAQGNDWRDQIDSSVLLQYSSGAFLASCSGTLLNNRRNDLTPYLLTADHCLINSGNDDSVVVYWQFQTATCNGDDSGAPDPGMSQSGTEFLADGFRSSPTPHPDFTLLIIGSISQPDVPPAAFRPFWSGWDSRPDAVASSGVGIHHPTGDEKSISVFDSPVSASLVDIGTTSADNVLAWQVHWSQGTTEQGSSGSGLWNQERRLVGQLAGGGASCAAQQEPDYYGRLHESWEWEASPGRQLRIWLDPDCAGELTLDGIAASGRDPSFVRAGAASAVRQADSVCAPTGGGNGGGNGGEPPPSGSGGGSGAPFWLLGFGLLKRWRYRALRD